MNKITEYKVARGYLEGYNGITLAREVGDSILLGWQPFGSLTAFQGYGYQAMVKYQEPVEENKQDISTKQLDHW